MPRLWHVKLKKKKDLKSYYLEIIPNCQSIFSILINFTTKVFFSNTKYTWYDFSNIKDTKIHFICYFMLLLMFLNKITSMDV